MQTSNSVTRTCKPKTASFAPNPLHWAWIVVFGIALMSANCARAQVQSEARTSIKLQACGSSCNPALYDAGEELSMSHGDGASPTSTFGYFPYFPAPLGPTQFAYANADLATSKLHVSLSGSADQTNQRLYGWLTAAIGDTLQIKGNGISRLSVDLSGSITTSNDPGYYIAWLGLRLLEPGSLDAFSRGDYENYRILNSVELMTGGSNFGSPQSLQFPSTLDLQFATPAGSFEWSLEFWGNYTLTGAQAVNMDLGHTLTVHLDAPAGAEIISASGFVPSATGWVPTSAVPEPSTWALFATGLLVTGWLARRRGRTAA